MISGVDQDGIRLGDRPPLQDANLDNACCDWWRDVRPTNIRTFGSRFGSAHPGGMNALLADGSVRTITYNIDLRVFSGLSRRDDEQVVSLQ